MFFFQPVPLQLWKDINVMHLNHGGNCDISYAPSNKHTATQEGNWALSLVVVLSYLLSKQRSVRFQPPASVAKIVCLLFDLGSPAYPAMLLIDTLKNN